MRPDIIDKCYRRMHRMSCFRDDIVFFVYLYQRHIYPSDHLRSCDEDVPDVIEVPDKPSGGKMTSNMTEPPVADKKNI